MIGSNAIKTTKKIGAGNAGDKRVAAAATRRPERQGFRLRNKSNDIPSSTMGTCRKLVSRISGIRPTGTTGVKHLCPISIVVCIE